MPHQQLDMDCRLYKNKILLLSWSYRIFPIELGTFHPKAVLPSSFKEGSHVGYYKNSVEQKFMKNFMLCFRFFSETILVRIQKCGVNSTSFMFFGSSPYFSICLKYSSYSYRFFGSEISTMYSFNKPMNSGRFMDFSILLSSSRVIFSSLISL